MDPHKAPKKIRKQEKFSSKKALIKHLLDMDSDLQEYVLEVQVPQPEDKIQDHFPMRFSQKYKDHSITLKDEAKIASVNQGGQGVVLLDFPLKEKTSWQLQMCPVSRSASFGINAIPNDHPGGLPSLNQSVMISRGDQKGQFSFDNNELVQLTFDPKKRTLGFFNTKTRKSCSIQVDPLREGYQYWPAIYLYKATVQLKQDYLIKKARQSASKV